MGSRVPEPVGSSLPMGVRREGLSGLQLPSLFHFSKHPAAISKRDRVYLLLALPSCESQLPSLQLWVLGPAPPPAGQNKHS